MDIFHASECLPDDLSLIDVAYCFEWKQVIYVYQCVHLFIFRLLCVEYDDPTLRLKRDCFFFEHYIPLFWQTLNGTLFAPFLEGSFVLTLS